MLLDRLIIEVDQALRVLAATPQSVRPVPGDCLPEADLGASARQQVAALMRVNHVGEVCAQALYRGQALTSRDPQLRESLAQAAREETEHLAWTAQRIRELGGRQSVLNPLWYVGALGMGVVAGLAGDKWNLGFLRETEQQVGAHLASHQARVPESDARTQAILSQMHADETAHAQTAEALGAAALPPPIQGLMKFASGVMTRLAYYV